MFTPTEDARINYLARYPSLGTVCTNFDHTIEWDIANSLTVQPDKSGNYTAWNFFAPVRWCPHAEHWVAQVWIHHRIAAYVVAETLEDLMEECCRRWGDD